MCGGRPAPAVLAAGDVIHIGLGHPACSIGAEEAANKLAKWPQLHCCMIKGSSESGNWKLEIRERRDLTANEKEHNSCL